MSLFVTGKVDAPQIKGTERFLNILLQILFLTTTNNKDPQRVKFDDIDVKIRRVNYREGRKSIEQ